MPSRPTVKIRLVFRDRGRNEASTHLYLPFSVPVDDVFTFVDAAMPRYNAVSDALIARVVVEYEYYFTDLPDPSPTSDVLQTLLLFYRNEDLEVEVISIPSPKDEIFEMTGDYAGVRIDMTSPAIIEWQQMTIGGTIQFLTKDNIIIGPELITGGMAI